MTDPWADLMDDSRCTGHLHTTIWPGTVEHCLICHEEVSCPPALGPGGMDGCDPSMVCRDCANILGRCEYCFGTLEHSADVRADDMTELKRRLLLLPDDMVVTDVCSFQSDDQFKNLVESRQTFLAGLGLLEPGGEPELCILLGSSENIQPFGAGWFFPDYAEKDVVGRFTLTEFARLCRESDNIRAALQWSSRIHLVFYGDSRLPEHRGDDDITVSEVLVLLLSLATRVRRLRLQGFCGADGRLEPSLFPSDLGDETEPAPLFGQLEPYPVVPVAPLLSDLHFIRCVLLDCDLKRVCPCLPSLKAIRVNFCRGFAPVTYQTYVAPYVQTLDADAFDEEWNVGEQEPDAVSAKNVHAHYHTGGIYPE